MCTDWHCPTKHWRPQISWMHTSKHIRINTDSEEHTGKSWMQRWVIGWVTSIVTPNFKTWNRQSPQTLKLRQSPQTLKLETNNHPKLYNLKQTMLCHAVSNQFWVFNTMHVVLLVKQGTYLIWKQTLANSYFRGCWWLVHVEGEQD